MYLHIGKGTIINENNIIAIFNIDALENDKTIEKVIKDLYIDKKEIIDISEGKLRSMVLTESDGKSKIYISHIFAGTIEKRSKKYSI